MWWRWSLTAWLLCGLHGVAALGQHLPDEVPYSFSFAGTPLDEALGQVAHAMHVDLVYNPALIAGGRTDCTITDDEPYRILACVVQETDLYVRRLDSGTFVLSRNQARARTPGHLAGRVVDHATGDPLPMAHVMLLGADRGTVTARNGLFRFLGLAPGMYHLVASYVGYEPEVRLVEVPSNQAGEMRIALDPRPVQFAPLVVDAGRERFSQAGRRLIANSEIIRPRGVGTPDVVLSMNTLMGVQINNALADVHIQGGEAGEHQFRLDGVPVFEPVHLRGLVGAFSPFALQRVTVHKAGFSAADGSHLSGVISAEHNLTPAQEGRRGLDVQVDPLSLNARLNARTRREDARQSQIMVAGRTGLWGLVQPPSMRNWLQEWNTPDDFLPQASLLALLASDPGLGSILPFLGDSLAVASPGRPDLGFQDLHAAGMTRWSDGRTLQASVYRGWNRLNGNRLSVEGPLEEGEEEDSGNETTRRTVANRDDYTWSNVAAQVHYMHVIGPTLLAEARVRGSRYALAHAYNSVDGERQVLPLPGGEFLQFRLTDDLSPSDDGNRMAEVAFEAGLEGTVPDLHHWQAGLELARITNRFEIEDLYLRPITYAYAGWRHAAFVQDQIALSERTRLETGARLTWIPQRRVAYFEPRFALRYEQTESEIGPWSVQGAVGLYRQFINQFDVSSFSPSALLPSVRFWLPIDTTFAPPAAFHAALDFDLRPGPTWTVQAEAYAKHQSELLMIDYAALWGQLREQVSATAQSDFLETGDGVAYGGAVRVEKRTEVLRLAARYDVTVARRRWTSRFEGRMVPAPWNEPHRVQLALDWNPVPDLTTIVRWRGVWGRSWGFRRAYYDYLATDPLTEEPLYEPFDLNQPEEHRLPAILQLDVGVAYTRALDPVKVQFRGDIVNVLGRQNVADWRLVPVESPEGETLYENAPRTLIPFSPSVAVRVYW